MSEIEVNNNWTKNTPFLVLINYYDGDIEWRHRLRLPHIVFTKNMPSREPYNAINQAKSETNLLKFIYEFYDRLPEHIINVHQYEIKPYSHDGSLVDLLNDPNFKYIYNIRKSNGYWNFCSYVLGEAAEQIERMKQCGWWKETMEPWFGDINKYHDFTLFKNGCAQFVVSRDRILSLPREFYLNMYQWLASKSTGPPRGQDPSDGPFSNMWTSRYMEWTWELIFSVHKPTEDVYQHIFRNLSMRALYGAGNYVIDVTTICKNTFLNLPFLNIDQDTNFNQIFGDVVSNAKKQLYLSFRVQGKECLQEYCIEEKHETQIIDLIKISEC